ncbi:MULTISPECIES: ATP-binding cassette domain-containing protein [unclassified Aureimonas]|uniref:thiamine ABC transporter ATP-binding protein n=1 Tax=unclassified Aureimonas TaxID=2615206 RepID=UPI000700AD4E|nr:MULTISPECIES: ATP-binding cassette domain-containing protein [unclassified Aureimonas]KQT69917.1 thiamine ABC transporter ATP-binding protein [Aureimonas sp. Leaf427]KQT75929.1 thiamine ABC transporter ATP-binding protein [Aureimonas sp. Leaf460]
MTAPALHLDGVATRFGAEEMIFDLSVSPGEWLAVIGPSGAGKSTLLDLVAGFLAPDAGRILIDGIDRTQSAPAERRLSMVFQDNNLFPHLDVFQNVALGITSRRRLSDGDRDRVEASLAAVGLEGFGARRPAEMSGGERQRVALARAFLRERPLLLLDEPFAALGPALRRNMLALLASLKAARAPAPMTIVLVTHNPEDARRHADRVAFLDKGRIAAIGPAAMLDDPADPALRAYLGL